MLVIPIHKDALTHTTHRTHTANVMHPTLKRGWKVLLLLLWRWDVVQKSIQIKFDPFLPLCFPNWVWTENSSACWAWRNSGNLLRASKRCEQKLHSLSRAGPVLFLFLSCLTKQLIFFFYFVNNYSLFGLVKWQKPATEYSTNAGLCLSKHVWDSKSTAGLLPSPLSHAKR